MPRFFLHLRDGSDAALDPEGIVCEDVRALRREVLKNARDIIAGDAVGGVIDLRFRIDAEDVGGRIVHSQPFSAAVTILGPDG